MAKGLEEGLSRRIYNATTSNTPLHWRPILCSSYLYKLSCFFYSITGVIYWFIIDEAATKWPSLVSSSSHLPFFFFIQGFLSYWSDAINPGYNSWAHPIDMMGAVGLACFFLHILIFEYISIPQYLLAVLSFIAAGTSFSFSRYYRTAGNKDVNKFIFWHILWHATSSFTLCVLPYYAIIFEPDGVSDRWYPDTMTTFWFPFIIHII